MLSRLLRRVRRLPARDIALAGAREPVLPSIPPSHLVLLLGILTWTTVMLKLGFSGDVTVMLLSAAAVVVSQLAGRSGQNPMPMGITSDTTRRSA